MAALALRTMRFLPFRVVVLDHGLELDRCRCLRINVFRLVNERRLSGAPRGGLVGGRGIARRLELGGPALDGFGPGSLLDRVDLSPRVITPFPSFTTLSSVTP